MQNSLTNTQTNTPAQGAQNDKLNYSKSMAKIG
jgi:hypothetical protein